MEFFLIVTLENITKEYTQGTFRFNAVENINLKIKALHDKQELDTAKSTQIIYWEGGINVEGFSQGVSVNGVGFVEMTGYAKYGRPKF